ncbi:hypothetical protein GCK72_000868 [Caenorhabditis remanei]|uniref:Uncharacterized protein n=1 Tax=Caenorhabditis remanei TaxID=31234 RepID=A0A6A5HN81_CAERE|nr:hypothetical protein GCK72_000868 [Caenorhabditis remanei]KAF1769055.1 hypothetical protein GCK72_000868 [Caenorhabditis remanei]
MRTRKFYTESEDVRMLKWVVRNEDLESATGIVIWKEYKFKYRSEHSDQSLLGRIRRQIIPNLIHYVSLLTPLEVVSLHRIFGSRLDPTTRIIMRQYISRWKSNDVAVGEKRTIRSSPVEKRSPRVEKTAEKTKNTEIPIVTVENDCMDIEVIESRENVELPKNPEPMQRGKRPTPTNPQPAEIPVPPLNPEHSSQSESVVPDSTEQETRSFCAEMWNMEMKSVAEQGALSIHNLLHKDKAIDKEKLEKLFEKMFAGPGADQDDFSITSVRSPHSKHTRMQYFFKNFQELNRLSANPHVRFAVFLFIQFFEYEIVHSLSHSREKYNEAMNRLTKIAIQIATL